MQASSSICEITGFETRTRDTRTPPSAPHLPKRASKAGYEEHKSKS